MRFNQWLYFLCVFALCMMAVVFAEEDHSSSDHDEDHSDDHSDDHDDEHHDSHEDHDDHHGHDKSTELMLKALGITSLSGCAALLGFCFVFCLNRDQIGLIPVSLGFSGGVIVYLTFMNLIPECIEQIFHSTDGGYEGLAHFYAMLTVLGGLLMSLSMERLIPHSHAHQHPAVNVEPQVADVELEEEYKPEINEIAPEISDIEMSANTNPEAADPQSVCNTKWKPMERQVSLPRVSYSVAAALILHHLPEGMAAFISLYHDLKFGILVSFALAIHDLPSGVCIALPTYLATGSKMKPFLLCLLAAFAYFLGGIFGWIIIVSSTERFIDCFIGVLFGLTSGVMLYVAFVEILPSAIVAANRHREMARGTVASPRGEVAANHEHRHQHNRVYLATITSIFIGFFVMDIGNILLAESGGHSH